MDFPDSQVVKTLLSNAGRGDSIPGLRAKIPHATKWLSPCSEAREWLHTATKTQHSQS